MDQSSPNDQLDEIKNECLELVELIEKSIFKIETDNNLELVDEIFRHFHNIKGIAGFMELWNMSKIASESEKILDLHRNKKILLNEDTGIVLKQAISIIKIDIHTPSDKTIKDKLEDYKNRVSKYIELLSQLAFTNNNDENSINVKNLNSTPAPIAENTSASWLQSSVKNSEGEDYLKDIEKIFAEVSVEMNHLSSGVFNKRDLKILQEAFENIYQLANRIGYDKMINSCHILNKFFKVYIKDMLAIPYEFIAKSKEVIDYVFGLVFLKKNSLPENLLKSQEMALAEFENEFNKITEQRKNEIFALFEDTSNFSFRINIENMLNIIKSVDTLSSDIKNIKASYKQAGDKLSISDQSSIQGIEKIENSFLQMQDLINKATKVPLKHLFFRFVRVVQNSAELVNKKIEFKMQGEHIEIDRFYLNPLNISIIHILRNSCDHGIETPEERIAKGKNPIGVIDVMASLDDKNLIIIIKDDGKGLSKSKITEKLLANKTYTAEQIKAMSDNDIFMQIFKPGFSTASKVTDISGRGVGMDVVNKEVEKIKGKVQIESKENKGLAITIILPNKPLIELN